MCFRIHRSFGAFGIVDVVWEIQDIVNFEMLSPGGDFIDTNGTATFNENEVFRTFYVAARSDGAPEEDKHFNIRIVKVIGKELVVVVR